MVTKVIKVKSCLVGQLSSLKSLIILSLSLIYIRMWHYIKYTFCHFREYNVSSMPLQQITIRNVSNLHKVFLTWPRLEKLKLIYNEFELSNENVTSNGQRTLDQGFKGLMELNRSDRLNIDMQLNGTNLLVPIEVNVYNLHFNLRDLMNNFIMLYIMYYNMY